MEQFCADMDVMLFFETVFHWPLIQACRDAGTLSILMPMYECTPHPLPLVPDKFICPSSLDMRYYPDNSKFIPVPVDVPWESRLKAHTFAHSAGYIGLNGRNGTLEVMQAMRHVKNQIDMLIRAQTDELNQVIDKCPDIRDDPRVTIQIGHVPYEELRQGIDVCVAPELFNGLSLPLQEARANGQLVISVNRTPANEYIPEESLVTPTGFEQTKAHGRARTMSKAIIDPKDLAAMIDKWYGQELGNYSLSGKYWAEDMSWESLGPLYMETIEEWRKEI